MVDEAATDGAQETLRSNVKNNRIGQIAIPAAIVGIVVMMVVPLPTALLDLLLVTNIALALLALLASMFTTRVLDFSIFPSYLLIGTLFRLALNVSVTRLVLLHGYAGKVIEAFGNFVVGGSVIVGLVIFLILIVIQFIVITNGAGRVAEVAARFTLDAMPGKQMAIDADLNSGLINDEEAKRRRREVGEEADFYGAMDGASKFVKGDAIAAIVIVVINLVGGFAVGILQNHMSFSEAIKTYSLLTVGDGLVAQIPALLISLSSGLIVTRAATEMDLGSDLLHQFTRHKQTLQLGGGAICAVAIVPGLPKVPFFIVGGLILLLATRLPSDEEIEAKAAAEQGSRSPRRSNSPPTRPSTSSARCASSRSSSRSRTTSSTSSMRPRAATSSTVCARCAASSRSSSASSFRSFVHATTSSSPRAPMRCASTVSMSGTAKRRPVTCSCSATMRDRSRASPPANPSSAFPPPGSRSSSGTRPRSRARPSSTGRRSSPRTSPRSSAATPGRLLSRQDVKMLIDVVKQSDPVVIDELNGANVTTGEIQRVLQMLLDEGVGIRDLIRIFEVISERSRATKDPEQIVEAVRTALGPAISASFAKDGKLPVITLDPLVEHALAETLRTGDTGTYLALDPQTAEQLALAVAREAEAAEMKGIEPVFVCATQLRPSVRRLLHAAAPRLPVLAYTELGAQLELDTIGVVNLGQPAAV